MAKKEPPISPEQASVLAEEAAREGYAHLFSIIVAAYNVEEYLTETLESVIHQSIGFDHTQIILIDDGSTDGTPAICDDYAIRYPENIVVIHQENKGVSAARNAGLDVANGKFINFLDSDDLWTKNAFSCALDFFQKHPTVKMAASRFVYFGAKEGNHRLNYKFKTTRVIDVLANRDYPQLSSSTCFFRADVLEGRRFCEELSVSEDSRLVNEILIDELSYGVMSEPRYRYRQRETADSAVDTMKQNRSWYLDTPKLCYEHLMELSRQKHHRVLPFIQYMVMYDLQWRIRAEASEDLTQEELDEYRATIVGLLREIDDEIISEQRTISIDYVGYALALKYGVTLRDVVDNVAVEDEWLVSRIADSAGVSRTLRLRPLESLSDSLTIERVSATEQHIDVEGILTSFRFKPEDVRIALMANNQLAPIELFEAADHELVNPFNDDSPGKTGFRCSLLTVPGTEVVLRGHVELLGVAERPLRFRFAKESGLPESVSEGDFSLTGDCLVRVARADTISLRHVLPESQPTEDEDPQAAEGEKPQEKTPLQEEDAPIQQEDTPLQVVLRAQKYQRLATGLRFGRILKSEWTYKA